ncbi:MAG: VOC family protein, partial [Chloroflexaceae bacterium]|nr:VOC family protein [Chloroflexaceae bacterium]
PLPEESVPGLLALLTGEFPSGRYRARQVTTAPKHAATWLNLVLQVDDVPAAAAFFQHQLGLTFEEEWREVGHGVLLGAGRATIELADAAQVAEVDRIETGEPRGNAIRLAIGVSDLNEFAARLQAAGVRPLHHAVDTPWNHRNQRFTLPAGLPVQALTLFEEKEKS